MKAGIATSIIAHGLVFGMAVVSLAAPRPLEVDDVEALPIDIIPIEDITRTVEGDTEADAVDKPAPRPTQAPERPEPAQNAGASDNDTKADAPTVEDTPPVEEVKAPAPAPRPEPVPKPTPVATPDVAPTPQPKTDIAALAQDALEAQAEPEPVEETPEIALPTKVATPKRRPARPRPEPARTPERKTAEAPKAEPSKKKADTKKKVALLDRQQTSAGGAKRTKKKPGLGAERGNNAAKLSASELDALRAQIQSCWNVGALAGSDDAETLRARVTFRLARNGEIEGRPDVSASGGTGRTERTFAGSARRAVIRCAPYRLPADKYETWSDVVVNFSLRDML